MVNDSEVTVTNHLNCRLILPVMQHCQMQISRQNFWKSNLGYPFRCRCQLERGEQTERIVVSCVADNKMAKWIQHVEVTVWLQCWHYCWHYGHSASMIIHASLILLEYGLCHVSRLASSIWSVLLFGSTYCLWYSWYMWSSDYWSMCHQYSFMTWLRCSQYDVWFCSKFSKSRYGSKRLRGSHDDTIVFQWEHSSSLRASSNGLCGFYSLTNSYHVIYSCFSF